MTVRHLLTHTSGLIDYEDLIAGGTTVQLRDADVLRLLEAENRPYFLAGNELPLQQRRLLLLASSPLALRGMDFASLLRKRIFLPLGMQGTVAFEAGISVVPHRAFGYSARPRVLDARRPKPDERDLGRRRHLLLPR